jgi:hypothetical protein
MKMMKIQEGGNEHAIGDVVGDHLVLLTLAITLPTFTSGTGSKAQSRFRW